MGHQREDLAPLGLADRCDQGMHDLHTAEGSCVRCACGQVRRLTSPPSADDRGRVPRPGRVRRSRGNARGVLGVPRSPANRSNPCVA
jgi:hypothetical protein